VTTLPEASFAALSGCQLPRGSDAFDDRFVLIVLKKSGLANWISKQERCSPTNFPTALAAA